MRRQLVELSQIRRAVESEPAGVGDGLRLLIARREGLSSEARSVLAAAQAAGVPLRRASPRELARLADGDARHAELLGLVGPDPAPSLDDLVAGGGALWLLVGTSYPGNAGFVMRTAEVSGAAGVVIDAAFDRNERRDAERASLHAERLFPVLHEDAARTIAAARDAGHRVLAVEDVGDRAPWDEALTGAVLFVLGGEASGVPEELLRACDAVLRLPMLGFIPSYNLQAAMAAVAGERLRQLASA